MRVLGPYFLVFILLTFAMLSLTGCGGSSSSNSGGGQDPSIVINTPPSQIGAGANWQFSATASHSSTVNWTVSTQNGGTIDSTGLYIAPTTGTFPMNVTITATAASDPGVTASTSIAVTQTDPLGTAQGTVTACPPFGGGLSQSSSTCYQINTSCEGVADFSAYLKVNAPTGTPLGTVIFGTGTGGVALYDFDQPDFFNGSTNGGLAVVQSVLDAGFTTVQVTFGGPFTDSTPNGWLTGPGGVRRLACRYATVAQWVYQNIHNSNTAAPLCATGNSGGSAAIGYALSDYGLDSIFSMVETTSGPPMSRLDQACLPATNSACTPQAFTCNAGDPAENLSICYTSDDAGIVDTAYPQPLCQNAINGSAPPDGLFLSDSILGAPARTFPKTRVNLLFGGQDQSAAVEQGLTWGNALGSTVKAQACISDAPHPIPSAADGAAAIATDIVNLCRLQ
ncbi:MAG TPA: hypothetical protein VHW45_12980 [Candidatus Sulfotelmatobacter sp.]|nr:hypothetical protein [Candidatus Sulfotelmatobacter sp.]